MDTVEPSLSAQEINLNLESKHEIYQPTRELNPGSSDRPSRSLDTVSQSPEPLRQVTHMLLNGTPELKWTI